MIVDERIARVGSANLSNRSMGLDSECDLVVDASDQPAAGDAVRRLLHELLAEHLDAAPDEVGEVIDREHSLIRAIDRLSGTPRRLVELDPPEPDWSAELLETGLSVVDPEAPASIDTLRSLFPVDSESSPSTTSRLFQRLAIVGVAALALAAVWRLTPLATWLDPAALERISAPARTSPLGPLLGIAGFVVLTYLLFPVTILIAASALLFGGWKGFAVAWLATLISAGSGHWLGRTWLHDLVESNAGRTVNRVARLAAQRGVVASAVIRLLPIAPFQLVNVIVGASGIRLRDFLIGGQLALTPGIATFALASDGLWQVLLDPTRENLGWALVLVVAALVVAAGLARWASRLQEKWSS
jgi:uncharacterized membrane protein YdjX (TVP38/TMEM64 family)